LKVAPTGGSGPTFSDEVFLAKSKATTDRIFPEPIIGNYQHIISNHRLAINKLMTLTTLICPLPQSCLQAASFCEVA
jgi:hypothetical protein